ncbi:MAG: alkaline phosphatase family protein [Clostridia bacterium]|nr:alkaline phosphatase family protein [Clostridia bacterium]
MHPNKEPLCFKNENETDPAARRYEHVAIVGLDGMGNFCKDTATPCMDRIFENGAATLHAVSLFPTISAQNWGAMLIGVDPEVHGLTNGGISQRPYTNRELPTIFATVRRAFPQSVLCSVSNWDPINRGIIEQDIGVEKQTADNGAHTTDRVVACVKEKKPALLFVQIDDPDEAGHRDGYGTAGHLSCISDVDAMVGRIYDAYVSAGIIDDTLFIVITDHGGFKHGHGGYTDTEKYIYFALAGKTVNKTTEFFAATKDINAIVRHAFGLEIPQPQPEGYSSQVPAGVFSDCNTPYLMDACGTRCDIVPQPQLDLFAENGLTAFFAPDEIKLAMFFEYNADDAMGRARFIEHGHVKYYSTGVRGAHAELGTTGRLVSEDVKFGTADFTVCAWLKVDGAPAAEAYYCGTKTMTDSGPGFMLGSTNMATWIGVETPDPNSYQEFTLPYFREVSGGWLHVTVVFRRKDCAIDLYRNFRHRKTMTLPAEFADVSMDALPFTVGDDASGKINTGNDALMNLDDLLIFNKAFGPADVEKLAAYYAFEQAEDRG